MKPWFDRLRFLWEEEIASPEEVPRADREASSGVPRSLRRATRFALTGALATGLMGQVVGIRLIARVDAEPSYRAACIRKCNEAFQDCRQKCPKGEDGGDCRENCQEKHDNCVGSCRDNERERGDG